MTYVRDTQFRMPFRISTQIPHGGAATTSVVLVDNPEADLKPVVLAFDLEVGGGTSMEWGFRHPTIPAIWVEGKISTNATHVGSTQSCVEYEGPAGYDVVARFISAGAATGKVHVDGGLI